MPVIKKLIAASALLAVLAGVFMMYGHPDILITVANQLWGCF